MWTFESIKKNSIAKWTAGVLGALLLSALGNPLWDVALKPALRRASYGLLSLSSLGIESVRTGIYERIATGSTSRAGVETLSLITLLAVALYGLMFFALL